MHISLSIKLPERLPRYAVFLGCLALGLLGWLTAAWADVPNMFKDGDVLTAQALNDNFAASGVPSGTIVAYGGDPTKVPGGWLLCDGSSLQRSAHPALFAAINTSWGSMDGVSFNAPDLRGRFLRGLGGASGTDPDCVSRAGAPGSSGTGCNAVGTIQSDAMQTHSHTLTLPGYGSGAGAPIEELAAGPANGLAVPYSTGAFGGSENRPKNSAVAYIIKL